MSDWPGGRKGTSPPGAGDEPTAALRVHEMFDKVAPRYDLLNHLLSCNVDRLWWARAARAFDSILKNPNSRILDLCCGTGDMALAVYRRRPEQNARAIIGADFSHPMLVRAVRKFAGKAILSVEADALNLPFENNSFHLVVSAFGFRNLANYEIGLKEMQRLLAPQGQLGILDFSEPSGVFGEIYRFYFKQVLPRIGAFISGVKGAYEYLPASVEKFPAPEQLLRKMKALGFVNPIWKPYSFGIAGLYRAEKR